MPRNEPITMETLKSPLDSDAVVFISSRNQRAGEGAADPISYLFHQGETPWPTISKYIDQQTRTEAWTFTPSRSLPGDKKVIFYASFHEDGKKTVWIVEIALSKRKSKGAAARKGGDIAKHERGENPRVSRALKTRMDKVLGKRR